MNQLTGPDSGWFDPPSLHEIDRCGWCHDEGCHDGDLEGWAEIEGCVACVDTLNKAIERKQYCLTHHEWFCEKESLLDSQVKEILD